MEAKAITGHDIEADFSGGDVQLSKEHSEGILRSLEAHPKTLVGRIGTYGPGGNWTNHFAADAYAITEPHAGPDRILGNGRHVRTDAIFFNNAKSGHVADSEGYRSELKMTHGERFFVGSTPQHVAMHETGHVFANYGGTKGFDSTAKVQVDVYAKAPNKAGGGTDAFEFTSKAISRYAAYDQYELTAEMFADVMINRGKASQLSKDGMAILQREHNTYMNTIGA